MKNEVVAQLMDVPANGLDAYLTEHSGLPGPRGNLDLADAFAVAAARALQIIGDADPGLMIALVAEWSESLPVCLRKSSDRPGASAYFCP